MAQQHMDLTVGIVRYHPQIKVTIPVTMMGPATLTVEDAIKLRDSLDAVIKKFKWGEGTPELVSPCGSCIHLRSFPNALHEVRCAAGEVNQMMADFSCYSEAP